MSTIEKLGEIRAAGLAKEDWFSFDYADLLRAVGLDVVTADEFGSWSGDYVFHVRDSGGRNGVLIQGYGSCSGCDALQSVEPPDDEGDLSDVAALADGMVANIVWAENGDLIGPLEAKIADENTWWAYSDDEALAKAREIARSAAPTSKEETR